MSVYIKTMSLSKPFLSKNLRKLSNTFSSGWGRNPKNYLQGRFKPLYPEKYKGDVNEIIFRSSWERGFMKFCDETSQVIAWSSEELIIPYHNPFDKNDRTRRYFIDFQMWVKVADGSIKTFIIEIKPYSQTIEPIKKRVSKEKYYNKRLKIYLINQAKWEAARQYAKQYNCEFLILTERDLYPKDTVMKKSREDNEKYKERGVKIYWPKKHRLNKLDRERKKREAALAAAGTE